MSWTSTGKVVGAIKERFGDIVDHVLVADLVSLTVTSVRKWWPHCAPSRAKCQSALLVGLDADPLLWPNVLVPITRFS